MALNLNNDGKVNGKHEINATNNHRAELDFVPKFVWTEVIVQTFVHVGSIVGIYYFISLQVKLLTCVWCKFSKYLLKSG